MVRHRARDDAGRMTTDTSSETHSHTNACWWDPARAGWVCTPAAARQDRDLVDVRDMIVVHTAMLREFRLAAPAVARVAPGDARQAAVVDDHLAFLCGLLHHHHTSEDDLLWPALRDRVPAAAQALIEDAESQHAGIDLALDRVHDARTDWRARPDGRNRDVLVAALRGLHVLLVEHLELEERTLLPLAASALTDAEWHAIGEQAVEAMPKPALVLAFGMFAYEGDPAVLRDMLRTAPAVPRLLLPRIAPRVYARRAAKIHGTARP